MFSTIFIFCSLFIPDFPRLLLLSFHFCSQNFLQPFFQGRSVGDKVISFPVSGHFPQKGYCSLPAFRIFCLSFSAVCVSVYRFPRVYLVWSFLSFLKLQVFLTNLKCFQPLFLLGLLRPCSFSSFGTLKTLLLNLCYCCTVL